MTHTTRAMLTWVSLLAALVLLAGCGPSVQTRTVHWPNGTPRLRQSFYVDSKGIEKLHGPSTYWDDQGKVLAEGTWRDGQPWTGRCWIPAAGDAGSWAGLGKWQDYRNGHVVSTP